MFFQSFQSLENLSYFLFFNIFFDFSHYISTRLVRGHAGVRQLGFVSERVLGEAARLVAPAYGTWAGTVNTVTHFFVTIKQMHTVSGEELQTEGTAHPFQSTKVEPDLC